MKTHWSTFITLEDFQRVAGAGISHIRLPVAYWYWDVEEGEPFPQPNIDDSDEYSPLYYIKQAFTWASQTGLKVNSKSLFNNPAVCLRLKLTCTLVLDPRTHLTTVVVDVTIRMTFIGAVMKVEAEVI